MHKISFIAMTEENKDRICNMLFSKGRDIHSDGLSSSVPTDNSKEFSEAEYIVNGFSEYTDADGVECAFSLSNKCLCVRIFDMGRYFFPLPFELCEKADIKAAVEHVAYYAVKEELPIVFTDVPPESISLFAQMGYKNMRVRRESAFGADESVSYRVHLMTECSELDKPPYLEREGLTLSALTNADIPTYARICTDETALSFWGYDYREDMPCASDEDFFITANSEFDRVVSLTVGVRLKEAFISASAFGIKGETLSNKDNKIGGYTHNGPTEQCDVLIGEVVFYAFDAKGGADFAFRLLPEYRGLGYGKKLLPLIFSYGKHIGLDRLMADVMKENSISLHLLASHMDLLSSANNIDRYLIEL